MIIDKDVVCNKVPEPLKIHNGMFHALARSDDPAIKCQNIVNLVNNLRVTIQMAGLEQYPVNPKMSDPSLIRFLDYQLLGANKAWNMYTRGDDRSKGYGVEIANTVLGEIMFLIYDRRFTTEDTGALFKKDAAPVASGVK